MEFIILGSVSVLFVTLAALFLGGRGSFLIAGYNTASEEEKSKIDEKALCKFVGKLMLIIALFPLFVALGIYFDSFWITMLATIAIVVFAIGATIYANTGDRFLNEE